MELLAIYGGLVFVIILSHPLTVSLSAIVHEKETRMKQVFKLTGVSEQALAISHIVSQLVFVSPMCIVLALLSRPLIAMNNSISELYFFFLSFVFSMIGIFNIISVFFTKQVQAR